MAPKKGAKRKSAETPAAVENLVEKKQYATRSSNRKRVSYNESDSNEETEAEVYEPPKKIMCSSSDDEVVTEDDEESHNEKNSKISPSTTFKNKKNLKPKKETLKKQNGKIISQLVPINVAFKPVSYDSSKIKSELNLSDDSDSESSSNDDCTPKQIQTNTFTSLSENLNNAEIYEGQDSVTQQKGEIPAESESVGISPWMKNLEALQNDYVIEEAPLVISHENTPSTTTSTSRKGKKLKQLPKKINKNVKRIESNEISVAEMLKLENAQSDCSEDDENWERVKPAMSDATDKERELPKSVEVTLDISGLKRKKKGMDVENLIRLKINRIRREIQLDLHQVSLVGLLAHGYLVNEMLSDPAIMGTALSIIPASGFPPTRTDLNYLEKLVEWIKNHFEVSATKESRTYPEKQDVLNCISSGKAKCVEELVYTCVALCRSLGILSRLVMSLQPLKAKVDSTELRPKTPPGQKKLKEASSSSKSEKIASDSEGGTKIKNNSEVSTGHKKTSKKLKGNSTKVQIQCGTEKHNEDAKSSTKSRSQNLHEKRGSQTSCSKTNDSKSPVKNSGKTSLEPKRSRRKSAEKPVKYEESPMEDTEEETTSQRKMSATKKKASPKDKTTKRTVKKEFKKPKSKKKPKRSQQSSSDDFEESMSDVSDDDENSKSSVNKKGDSAQSQSRKILSTDSEAETLVKKKKTTDVWMEVYLEQEEQWMSVDVISGQIHCDRNLERNASDPLLYVVAYNFDLTWKDVTARYASSFLSTTRKQRAHPAWSKLMNIRREKPSVRSKAEDESLEKSLTERPMPTSISEFKSHPLYALQRHLLKFEAIYPPTAIPVGFIRKEPIYARECVKNLHSRETWLKEAKVVRIGEKPYKIVKARPKWDRYAQKVITDQPLELFGDWQIEDYIPPPAVDGVVPRNAYGNVELFLPSMLPKGTKHLQIPGLNKVARRLGIDCAPAMTGWDYHGGWSHPVYDGFVVCDEHVETLMDAWQAANAEQEKREQEKKEKRVYDNWRRLIRGLLIRERIQAKYFKNLTEEEVPSPVDSTVSGTIPTASSSQATKKPTTNQRKKKS